MLTWVGLGWLVGCKYFVLVLPFFLILFVTSVCGFLTDVSCTSVSSFFLVDSSFLLGSFLLLGLGVFDDCCFVFRSVFSSFSCCYYWAFFTWGLIVRAERRKRARWTLVVMGGWMGDVVCLLSCLLRAVGNFLNLRRRYI